VAGTDPALPESRLVAVAAARAAAEKQGADIAVLDVRSLIVITDYFVIVSGSTSRQVKTIVDAAEEALRGLGVKPLRREGVTEGRWVLLDYVDVVVHVFGEEERRYYDLERLWKDAERLSWEDKDAASSG
jgi:ribosome-associated protein